MFLLFGFGLWFWAIILVEFCLLTWFVEEEWGAASIVSLGAFLVLLWWLADVPVWTWIRDNPGQLAMYCLYYVIIGIAWSVGKYFFELRKIRKYLKEKKEYWATNKEKYDGVQNFKQYLEKVSSSTYNKSDFEGSSKKLVFWASLWPPSMFWTILNDPIRKFFKFLINDVFIGIYRSMHKKMIGDLIDKE